MAGFSARMVHPDGPAPFPKDLSEDRDNSQDPRSVFTIADDVEQAKEILRRDNPGFTFLSDPTEQE